MAGFCDHGDEPSVSKKKWGYSLTSRVHIRLFKEYPGKVATVGMTCRGPFQFILFLRRVKEGFVDSLSYCAFRQMADKREELVSCIANLIFIPERKPWVKHEGSSQNLSKTNFPRIRAKYEV